MTKIPRHGYVCSIDNPTVPQAIASSCGDCEITPAKGVGTVYTADTGFQQTVESPVKSCQVTLSIIHTTGIAEAYRIFMNWHMEANPGPRTLTIDWPDSNSGSTRVTGEFSLQSMQAAQRSPGSADAEISQAVLISDGTYTWDEIP